MEDLSLSEECIVGRLRRQVIEEREEERGRELQLVCKMNKNI